MPEPVAHVDPAMNGHAAALTNADAASTRPRPAESDGRPWVRLPEVDWEYRGLVGSVAALMRDEGWMRQGDSIVTLDAERFMLVPVTPEGNLTDIEAQVRFWKLNKKTRRMVPSPITLQAARIIVRSSLTRAFLHTISMLSRCPVPIACDDELREVTQGFNTLTGVFVHPRARTPEDVPF